MSGSATLVRWLLANGLLDRLNLMVHPFAVGKGQRLFEDTPTHRLQLVSQETFSTGVLNLVADAPPTLDARTPPLASGIVPPHTRSTCADRFRLRSRCYDRVGGGRERRASEAHGWRPRNVKRAAVSRWCMADSTMRRSRSS